jgi:glycosyltransferase involved in cell wall biosynthesis
MTAALTYALVTPARNEEAFIELTLKSVTSQSILPLKWVIVSDGSTDRTDEIVSGYASKWPWIELVRMPERSSRDFAGKVGCFNAGYARLTDVPYDIIGCLDGDLSFDSEYFSFLLGKFAEDPKLGLAGTPFSEGGETYDYRFSSTDHVSGACQLFRRQCYEEIGGYVPMKGGGIDVVAVLSARSKGWRTQSFIEKFTVHHRPMGSANNRKRIAANFNLGKRAYNVGFHPLWQVFRSIYQMSRKPYVAGGAALFVGYFWTMLQGKERLISKELVTFQHQDQMRRLKSFFKSVPKLAGFASPKPATQPKP